jgi:hypothetical protein
MDALNNDTANNTLKQEAYRKTSYNMSSMDALKFINKFLTSMTDDLDMMIMYGCHPKWQTYPDSVEVEFYIFFQDNNLLDDEYSLDHDKLSEFILNENNIIWSKKFFNFIETQGLRLHTNPDALDDQWHGSHLDEDEDILTHKEKQIRDEIQNYGGIRTFEQLFEAFEAITTGDFKPRDHRVHSMVPLHRRLQTS